jgi:hypothetical protein
MNSKTCARLIALALLAMLSPPLQLDAQDNQNNKHRKHHRYKFIDIGTLGGPNSYFSAGVRKPGP